MDVLSQIIRSHTTGAVLLARFDYRGAWGVELDDQRAAGLHFVESGTCFLRLAGQEPVRLMQGDVALLPLGSGHILSDAPRRRSVKLQDFLNAPQEGPVNAKVVCAAQNFDVDVRRMHPLMHELPPIICLDNATVQACPSLSSCLRLLLQELSGEAPGKGALVDLLLETFLIYVLRNWVEAQNRASGWVGVIRDPRMSRALQAIHQTPEHEWTVHELAEVAGMSRPAFAKKFRAMVHEPPLGYVTQVRMKKAAEWLRETDDTLGEIAERIGYTSEFAFSRAFKRTIGQAPSHFRSSPSGLSARPSFRAKETPSS